MDKKIAEYLKKAKTLAWIVRLIPLPFSLVIATAMSKLVSAAASGMPTQAVSYSAILLAAAGAQCIFNVLIQNSFEKALALALHKCKIALYADFLSNPLHIYDHSFPLRCKAQKVMKLARPLRSNVKSDRLCLRKQAHYRARGGECAQQKCCTVYLCAPDALSSTDECGLRTP